MASYSVFSLIVFSLCWIFVDFLPWSVFALRTEFLEYFCRFHSLDCCFLTIGFIIILKWLKDWVSDFHTRDLSSSLGFDKFIPCGQRSGGLHSIQMWFLMIDDRLYMSGLLLITVMVTTVSASLCFSQQIIQGLHFILRCPCYSVIIYLSTE